MKQIIKTAAAICISSLLLLACKKDITQTVKTDGTAAIITLTPSTVVLTSAKANDTVATFAWSRADFGFKAAVNYTVEIVKTGNPFSAAKIVSVASAVQLKYVGAALNDAAIGLGVVAGTTAVLDIRIKSSLSDAVYIYSPVSKMTITTYQAEFPALLVRGGNSWITPNVRTKGFVLTAPDFNGKYEGYVYFPNADGWGGDGLKLQDQSSGVYYGWGTSATTMIAGSAGNLWFTPAPNYMKVNADVNAGTVNFTPVQFFISGNHNGWSTSATPMTFNAATQQWIATNVNFTAGNQFVFTSNGNYDISYKVNAEGKVVYAGPPTWAGSNLVAPATGSFTVILDLSAGNGSYTYKIQ
jgi:hypothetical protein